MKIFFNSRLLDQVHYIAQTLGNGVIGKLNREDARAGKHHHFIGVGQDSTNRSIIRLLNAGTHFVEVPGGGKLYLTRMTIFGTSNFLATSSVTAVP